VGPVQSLWDGEGPDHTAPKGRMREVPLVRAKQKWLRGGLTGDFSCLLGGC